MYGCLSISGLVVIVLFVLKATTSTTAASMERLVGPTLTHRRRRGTTTKTTDLLCGIQIVGFYFSAHWCPPCREFTPRLGARYNQLRNKAFEIIFTSLDHNEEEFTSYFASMEDWLAVPFSSTSIRKDLNRQFSVQSIPRLVLMNWVTGDKITDDGCKLIMDVAYMDRIVPDRVEVDMVGINMEGVLTRLNDLAKKTSKEEQNQHYAALNTIGVLLNNVLSHPGDPKYMTIKRSNKVIQSKLLGDAVYFQLLKLAGFKESPDADELTWPENCSNTKLKVVRDTVHGIVSTMEPI